VPGNLGRMESVHRFLTGWLRLTKMEVDIINLPMISK